MIKNIKVFFFYVSILPLILSPFLLGFPSNARASDPLLEQWMGIYSKHGKIGYSHGWVSGTKETGFTVGNESRIKLSGGGRFGKGTGGMDTNITEKAELNGHLRPLKFRSTVTLFDREQVTTGKIEKGSLTYRVYSADAVISKTIPFPEGAVLSSCVDFTLHKRGFKVGERIDLKIFMESLQLMAPLEIHIREKKKVPWKGATVDVFVIHKKMMSMTSLAWVTREGLTLREHSPTGFESLWEPKEKAVELGDSLVSMDSFLASSVVKLDKPIRDPRGKKILKIKLTRALQPDSESSVRDFIMEDRRQRVVSRKTVQKKEGIFQEWILFIESGENNPTGDLPFPVTKKRFEEYLEETPMVQANHPEIRKRAEEVVKGSVSAHSAALKINQWVFGYLKKKMVDNFSALDAYKRGAGECQSHTALFVALARSVGIPARVVSGLVYSKEFNGFFYHAWPEVYTGEWIALDPTLGQDSADATHIKLTVGEWKGQMKLLGFIGKINIEVME